MFLIDPDEFCGELIPAVEKTVREHLHNQVKAYKDDDALGGSPREWGRLLGIIGDWTKEHLSTIHDTDKKSQGEWRLPFLDQYEYAMKIGKGKDALAECRRKLRSIARTYLFMSPTLPTISACERLCSMGDTTLNCADIVFACAEVDSGRVTRFVKIPWLNFLTSFDDPYSVAEFARFGCITPSCLRNNFLDVEFNVHLFKSWQRHFGNEAPIAMWFSDQSKFLSPFEPKRGIVPNGFELNISIPNWALRFSFYNPNIENEWKDVIPQHGMIDVTHTELIAMAKDQVKNQNVNDANEFATLAENLTKKAIHNVIIELNSYIAGAELVSKNYVNDSVKIKKSELARARRMDRRVAMQEAEEFLTTRLAWFPRIFSRSIAGSIFLAGLDKLIEPQFGLPSSQISFEESTRMDLPNYGTGFHSERLLAPSSVYLYRGKSSRRLFPLKIDCDRNLSVRTFESIEPDVLNQMFREFNWKKRLDLSQDLRKFALDQNLTRKFHIAPLILTR